jgi:hypothetical protein
MAAPIQNSVLRQSPLAVNPRPLSAGLTLTVICLLVLIAFWARTHFLFAEIYYSDEFISMLAAKMVAERGLPILPSGLMYDQGLPLSLAGGALTALLGFREVIVRWPVLLVGTLTVVVTYAAARRLFDSRLVAVLAAALVALDPLSVVWSGRARGHSFAHLLVLLSLTTVWLGVFARPRRATRLLFLAAMVLAVVSHNVAALSVMPVGLLVAIGVVRWRPAWMRERGVWVEVIAAGVAAAVVFGIFSVGQIGSTVSLQDPYAEAPAPLGIEFLRGFFMPGLEWSRFDDLIGYLIRPGTAWLLPALAVSLIISLVRCARRSAIPADYAFLFLVLYVGVLILEQGALLTRSWQRPYLLYVTAWPAFLLAGAFSLGRVVQWLSEQASRLLSSLLRNRIPHSSASGWGRMPGVASSWPSRLALLAVLGLPALTWGPETVRIGLTERGTGDYNTAFEFVRQHMQPGDRIMTFHTSAAYLYVGRCDFYANQVSAKVLEDENEETTLVDRYTGSPLIDTVDRLNAVLAEGPLWFVVDSSRLERRYEPFFRQQILAQMDLVHTTGGVLVFRSRSHPLPVAKEPPVALDANFAGAVLLEGYALSAIAPPPDGGVSVTLYWRLLADHPLGLGPTKVFVQLRDRDGRTVAQADHYVYQGLLTASEWNRLRSQGEPLRDAAWLALAEPLPVASGPYRLFVGLYNPQTMKRIPLLSDTSGENAVVIDLPTR